MDHALDEVDPAATAAMAPDANDVDGAPPAEGENDDDWGPAFFEEEEECVSLLARVRESLQLQGDRDATLPTVAEEPNGVAAALDRLDRIIARYQESPHLLHGYLEVLLGPLVVMLQGLLPAATDVWSMEDGVEEPRGDDAAEAQGEPRYTLGANYDEYDADAAKTAIHHVSRAIYVIVKTAGEKCCTSYFSNDVKLCEDVFYALRLWQRSAKYRREWEVRYCLLLWLSNLVLVPFSLSIIDSAGRDGSLSDAVLQAAMAFLSDTSKCREGAALLVARLLTRPDGETHRRRFFAYAREAITDSSKSGLPLHGVLVALAKTLKCGQRRELAPYAPGLIPLVAGVLESRGGDALVCKAAIKVEQRLALALLRGRSAPWKYQRHVTSLDKNLTSSMPPGAAVEATSSGGAHRSDGNGNGNNNDTDKGETDVDNADDECVVENDEGLEEAIGLILASLSHKDTVVRWSAAKGIGRICDRLPRAMAEDVILAVLDVFTNENSDSSWHGGLLAVAELCRRSILHPQHLAKMLPRITQGLAFDLIKGTYSVGSHVRDAACYACWSIARAYDASDIEEHVHKLSSSLVVTSLFDREVHVRRAAAAAFQECVGRLGNFPDGIRLVTTMDFFSLASLQNAYLHVAPLVAVNESYRERMLEELVANKLLHWDRRVRCCAARALGLLATLEVETAVREIVPELLRRVTESSVATRHGAILGLAEMIEALDASVWPEEAISHFATLTPRVDAARLFRSRGGEYVRQACCHLLAAAAHRRLSLPETVEVQKVGGAVARAKTLGKLQEFFEDTWKQILEWLQFAAADAYEAFAATYYTEFVAPFHHKVLERMLDGSGEDRNPMERRGNLLAMGALPWSVICAAPSPSTEEEEGAGEGKTAYFMMLLRAAMEGTRPGKRKELQDAESRRNAVRALRKILLRIPPGTPQLTAELYESVVQHILNALDDYAADRRGDVGSFVRLEAIDALPAVVEYGMQCGRCGPPLVLRVAQALLKQSMEKLDRLRGRAVLSLSRLLQFLNDIPDKNEASDISVLSKALSENETAEWSLPQVAFMTLACPLLETNLFAPCVVEGLAVSAGSLSLHIMQPAVNAFLHGFRVSLENRVRLSHVLIEVAAKYVHNERVVVPLCVTINRLMAAGVFDESCHMDAVDILRHELKHYATSIHVLLPLVGVLGDLCRSNVPEAREAAWGLSLVMIASRYPKVRAKMATDMYTALLVLTSAAASDGCARAMQHLAATQWDANEVAKVRGARDELYGMLNISPPSKGTGGDEVQQQQQQQQQKKKSRMVAGSYLHLVHEAGGRGPMATNEGNIVQALREQKHYDAFHWVLPSNEFIAANDITDHFMIYLRAIGGWRARRIAYDDDGEEEEKGAGETKEQGNGGTSSAMEFVSEKQQQSGGGGAETLFATLQLLHMEQPVTPLMQSSHTRGGACTFDEWIIFPISVRDVPLDAVVRCCVYSRHGLVGCATFHPFTASGRLKAGPRRYKLHTGSSAGPKKTETPWWERLARDLHDGLLQPVPWMDKLVEQRLAQMREVQEEESNALVPEGEASPTISLFFPRVRTRLPVFLLSVPLNMVPTMLPSIPLAATPTQPYLDICMGDENLCEAKAHALSKSLFLISDADADAHPGLMERRQLQEIMRKPLIHLEGLKVDDEMLLWRFRFFLARDPAYFVLFMRCVNWKNEAEQQEALKVMHQWKPIGFSQALVCLSFYFREVVYVRRYAIGLLDRKSDEHILRFLLQLVQGVRYDVKDELEQFLLRRALGCWELCSTLFWYVHVESLLEKSAETDSRRGDENGRYTVFLQHLVSTLEGAKPQFLQRIRRQEKLTGVLRGLYRTILRDPRDRVKRMEFATSLIDSKKCGIHELFSPPSEPRSSRAADGANPVTLPTHPCFVVENITSSGFHMFKSAKMPMKVPLLVQPDCSKNSMCESALHAAPEDAAASAPCFVPLSLPSPEVGVIFKSGDDVRQDQLVVQLVQLMDSMLRQDGLDLCLTPYRVLATGTTEGLVELVPDVVTFQSVQRDIAGFIRSHNPTAKTYEAAMCRFTKSFAGYCVLTFILGIGDRHLENILVTHDGRLLHIDFGYILGNDPKPFPPPMKINKEMVETLGGPQSERYAEFKSYCCSSYNIIRKHAPLILSMLLLMVDASIPQISGEGKLDPRVNLLKVQDKLRLDLSNAQAAQYIQNVIADSVGSIFTNLWDVIHVAAQATRH